MAISKSTVETWVEEENTLWRARIEVTLMEGAISHRLGRSGIMHLGTERNWRESSKASQMHVPTYIIHIQVPVPVHVHT